MEEINLTHGQFRILLNLTSEPDKYTPQVASLVGALHRATVSGHLWGTKLTEADAEVAFGLFAAYRRDFRSPGSTQAFQYFYRDSATARRIYEASREQSDVPRETSSIEGEQ